MNDDKIFIELENKNYEVLTIFSSKDGFTNYIALLPVVDKEDVSNDIEVGLYACDFTFENDTEGLKISGISSEAEYEEALRLFNNLLV